MIHPEITRGLRGNPYLVRVWQYLLKRCHYVKEEDKFILNIPDISYHDWSGDSERDRLIWTALLITLESNPHKKHTITHHIGIVKSVGNSPVYMMGKEFFEVLKKVDLNIPTRLLPESGKGYVAVPPFIRDSCGYLTTCDGFYYEFKKSNNLLNIVFEMTHEENRSMDDESIEKWCKAIPEDFTTKKLRWEMAAYAEAAHLILFPSGIVSMTIEDGESVEECIEAYASSAVGKEHLLPNGVSAADALRKEKDTVRWFINAILYIYSQQPDLVKSKTRDSMTNSERRAYVKSGGTVSDHLIPVIYVSWNYKKPIQYSKDSTWVESHPRWQPCGPGRTQVRLVWVTEHERHFKNKRIESIEDSNQQV